jgi:hypothetical protein
MPKEQPFLRNIPAVDEYIYFPVISHLVIFLHVIGLELYPCGRSTKSHGMVYDTSLEVQYLRGEFEKKCEVEEHHKGAS